eukprot:12409522-Karenia_brevis.AAC.1
MDTQSVDSYDEKEERLALQKCNAPEWFVESTILGRKEQRKQAKKTDKKIKGVEKKVVLLEDNITEVREAQKKMSQDVHSRMDAQDRRLVKLEQTLAEKTNVAPGNVFVTPTKRGTGTFRSPGSAGSTAETEGGGLRNFILRFTGWAPGTRESTILQDIAKAKLQVASFKEFGSEQFFCKAARCNDAYLKLHSGTRSDEMWALLSEWKSVGPLSQSRGLTIKLSKDSTAAERGLWSSFKNSAAALRKWVAENPEIKDE